MVEILLRLKIRYIFPMLHWGMPVSSIRAAAVFKGV